uniref:Geraniol synthase n=1 Tax=Origanum majorana TaxID=268884 RepID=A0A516IJT6_ORIMA|nr:geraniol synthase [Origanum majorana]
MSCARITNRRKLERDDSEAVERLKHIDNIQQLRIGYYLEDATNAVLRSPLCTGDEDPFTAVVARLIRLLLVLAASLHCDVAQSLYVSSHLRLVRFEASRFYGKPSHHHADLLELPILDHTQVQAQHQSELSELTEIIRWWKIEQGNSNLSVIDAISDTSGEMDDLILSTDEIRKWDHEEMAELHEYKKKCYKASYKNTKEVSNKVLRDTGMIVLLNLTSTSIDMIEGEAKWFNGGSAPKLEEYIENGVSTGGAYMAFMHIYYHIREGVTQQNSQHFTQKPNMKVFSAAPRILRLWDDLGTTKEKQERGDMATSEQSFRTETSSTQDEPSSRISDEIKKELNEELVYNKNMQLSIIKVTLNIAKATQVMSDTYPFFTQ